MDDKKKKNVNVSFWGDEIDEIYIEARKHALSLNITATEYIKIAISQKNQEEAQKQKLGD